MPAKFYTPDEIQASKDRAVIIAATHVEAIYAELDKGFGKALFFTCMRLWQCGPAVTASRLNGNTKDQVINAWRWSETLSGVLLKKQGYEFTPLFLQTDKLAETLTEKGDLWIDFREVRKEIGL